MKSMFKALYLGLTSVFGVLYGFAGVMGSAAVAYGWSLEGSLDKGISFFIREFSRFFAENSHNPVLYGVGKVFTQYVNMISSYPWAHLAILTIAVVAFFACIKRFGSFMQEVDAVISTSTTSACRAKASRGADVLKTGNSSVDFKQSEVTDEEPKKLQKAS